MDITTFLGILVFLSWPAIALGYPLFASIMAVKNDSRDQMKKLVKYWILFSLFSLFEFAFVKITEGIPYWSIVRLVVIICCLVMTQFKGACLAYQGLARTVLFVQRLCQRETVPDVVQNNTEENASEPLATPLATHSALEVLNGTDVGTNVEEQTPPEASAEDGCSKITPMKKEQEMIREEPYPSQSRLNADIRENHMPKIESPKPSMRDAIAGSSVQHRESNSVARDLMGTFTAADLKPPKETAEKRSPWTSPKKAQQDGNVSEKLIKDSGSEGKLIASETECGECGKSHGDVQVVESKERSGQAPVLWLPKPFLDADSEDIMPPKETAEKRSPYTPPFKKAQQDKEPSPSATTKLKDGKVAEKLIKDIGSEGKLIASKQEQSVKVSASRAAAVVKGIMQPKELAEDRCQETPLVKKAQQDKGPSPSAAIKLKDGNVAEKLSKDSGSEGKLILRKTQTKHGECSNSHGDVQIVESKEKNGPPASQQCANDEVKENMPPKAQQEQKSEFESLEASNVVGTGITDGTFPKRCTVCRVELSCDYYVSTHLKGRKHNKKVSQKNGEP